MLILSRVVQLLVLQTFYRTWDLPLAPMPPGPGVYAQLYDGGPGEHKTLMKSRQDAARADISMSFSLWASARVCRFKLIRALICQGQG